MAKSNEEKIKSEKQAEEKAKKKAEKKEKATKKAKSTEQKPKKKSDKWSSVKNLGGLLFAKMMRGGASELRAHTEKVNKLNVFPVPDGDTGDNMRMTIESGIAAIENNDSDNLAEVMHEVSRGMLLGARGNSGVILSQFFAGIAKGFENSENADPIALGQALKMGVAQAYTSVMTPTEGTILTVAREAVDYAVSRITPQSTIRTLFSDLVKEMYDAVDRTPEALTVLREAGVVDSGGAGLFYIMDGLNRVLNGEEVADTPVAVGDTPRPGTTPINSGFGPDSEMTYGYCTELLVQLQNKKTDIDNFDIEALKSFLGSVGDSVVAFQTESIVKIHVHTLTPEKVLAHMRTFGEFLTVKIENMSVQHTELKKEESNSTEAAPVAEEKDIVASEPKITVDRSALPRKKYGIVAVSSGSGISELFTQLGADEIVAGGQTNNPSTSDFLSAFAKINAEHIFVFPNNSNIVMAASQAAGIYEDAKVHVVPAKTIGAGYVALSSMNFDSSEPEALISEAEEAIARIRGAYVSPAVRDTDLNGVHITSGDTIGVIDKEVVVSLPDRTEATHKLVEALLDEGRFMVTIFCGVDASDEERAELEQFINDNRPGVEAYFLDGGQDIYPYIFVAE